MMQIGGTIQEKLIPGLVKAIMEDNSLADPDDQDVVELKGSTLNTLLPVLNKSRVTTYHPTSLGYTEEYCLNKRIAFNCVRIDADPTNNLGRYYRPKTGQDITGKCDSNGDPMMDYSDVVKTISELRDLSKKSVVNGKQIAKVIDDNVSEMTEELPRLRVRG